MTKFDPADVERLSNLQPHELPTNLAPDVKDAVVKRMMEKRANQPKVKKTVSKETKALGQALKKRQARKKIPTVRRGEGGKAVSTRTPIIPQTEEQEKKIVNKRTVSRVSTPRTRKTRSGKKLDKVTGKVLTPTVRRGESGKIEAIPQEERANITSLPTAGEELMQPKPRSLTAQPQGTLRAGGQRVNRGFVAPYKLVKAGVDAALGHLSKMKETLGTGEFDTHHQNFNAIHQKLSEIDPHGLGISLGRLKHETIHGKNPRILDSLHNLVQDRLAEGKQAHEENVKRAQEGRARKATQ